MDYLIYGLSMGLTTIMVAGLALLFKHMHYPYGDAPLFLEFAGLTKNFVWLEKHYGGVWPSKTGVDDFGEKVYFNHYNVFVNLLKMLPETNRLRWGQGVNIILFISTVALLFLLQYSISLSLAVPPHYALSSALLFALILGARTKFHFITTLLVSEIVNFFLLIATALLAHQITTGSTLPLVLAAGITTGLSYRNKHTEILLVIAFILFLLQQRVSIVLLSAYILAVGLINIDSLYMQLFSRQDHPRYLGSIWEENIHTNSGIIQGILSHLNIVFVGLKKMFNFYSNESFWPSLGTMLLLFPFSLFYLISTRSLEGAFLLLFAYSLLYVLATLVVRRNEQGKQYNSYFFGTKWVYSLFPVVVLANGVTFSLLVSQQRHAAVACFMVCISCYTIHQAYKVVDHYFSPALQETNLPVYLKKPDRFRVDLADFIRSRESKKTILLGYYLKWGEIYGHFLGSNLLRVVNSYMQISDAELLQIVKRFGVTHIVVTPMSFYVGKGCSLRCQELSPILQGKLKRLDYSPQVTLYEVVDQEQSKGEGLL